MQSDENFGEVHLEEVIGGVVHQHDESPSADVVDTPGEADKEDGGYMVNYLLLEVLRTPRCDRERRGLKNTRVNKSF